MYRFMERHYFTRKKNVYYREAYGLFFFSSSNLVLLLGLVRTPRSRCEKGGAPTETHADPKDTVNGGKRD